MAINSRELESLLAPALLTDRVKALAVMDYLFDLNEFAIETSARKNIAAFDNGSGDRMTIRFFGKNSAFIKGFAHESEMTAHGEPAFVAEAVNGVLSFPGVLSKIPAKFLPFPSNEDGIEFPTFCIWYLSKTAGWTIGNIEFPSTEDPDGSESLLKIFALNASEYALRASDISGLEIMESLVTDIFGLKPLTFDMIQPFKESVPRYLKKVGYPFDPALPLDDTPDVNSEWEITHYKLEEPVIEKTPEDKEWEAAQKAREEEEKAKLEKLFRRSP